MASADVGPAPPLPAGYTLRIGTRRSALALKQVDLVMAELQAVHPHIKFEVQALATMGDKDKVSPLPSMGKGLWTTELEAKLATRELDMVVHSLKDMPTYLPEGCVLGCITKREDPRDVVVFRAAHGGKYKTLADLPSGAVVGTSSVRRAAQLRRRYPGLVFRDVRGNIDTRLRKVDDEAEGFDCIILAAAGLHRMDLGGRIAQYLDAHAGMLYAVGQGALAIEAREGDEAVLGVLRAVQDTEATIRCAAERSVMRTLEGGCSVPIGVETDFVPGEGGVGMALRLQATVVSLDGRDAVEADVTKEVATSEAAEAFGREVAQLLVDQGANRILEVINKAKSVSESKPSVVI